MRTRRHVEPPGLAPLVSVLVLLGCAGETGDTFRDQLGESREAAEEMPRRVAVHAPPELESIATDEVGRDGAPRRVACVNCHSIPGLASSFEPDPGALGPPHEGIVLAHGPNTCAACHDPDDRLALRLADARRVAMTDTIELCAQCHGPQYRDHRRGSHGGARGVWDAASGVRLRDHCVDCHDAHRPAYPRVLPLPAPRDAVRHGDPE